MNWIWYLIGIIYALGAVCVLFTERTIFKHQLQEMNPWKHQLILFIMWLGSPVFVMGFLGILFKNLFKRA